MPLADRIAVMRAGRLLQLATPREVYEKPATSFVGAFLGSPRMNLLPARAEADAIVAGGFRLPKPAGALPARLEVGVRPEHVSLVATGGAADGAADGEILAVEPLGAETHLLLRVGGEELRAQSPGFDPRRRGDSVRVKVDAAHAMVFDADGEGERVA
jgi:multiple sugar transport system ATP-binding protein